MVRLRKKDALLGSLLFPVCLAAENNPQQLGAGPAQALSSRSRSLKGRFLHITDFHPDPFFKTYSSTEENAACHRKHGPAGYYGAETSACDSPLSLVNATMDWIRDHVADDIDFVVWTGDSARHDNDEKLPRTQAQIVAQNEFMVQKMSEVFGGKHGEMKVPVVPTFGNNDIMPHNILLKGPNRWTGRYLDLWRSFIPEEQRHQFAQGGWFSVEVIPGKLAVVSLNTLYFFTSNSGVDGCARKKEPGYEQFEWLRIQLQLMRDRGMSAILIGHVPPARVDSKESWDETCWQKYALWEQQYRDVIVASLFGHMNIDHFMLQDFHEIKKGTKKGRMSASSTLANGAVQVQGGGLLTDGEVTLSSASDYLHELRYWWSKLPSPPSKKNNEQPSIASYVDATTEQQPLSLWQKAIAFFSIPAEDPIDAQKKSFLDKIGGPFAERYSTSLVSPSVVPNYFPTIRIFSYNISGLNNLVIPPSPPPSALPPREGVFNDLFDDDAYTGHMDATHKKKHKKKQKEELKKKKKYKFKVPEGPAKTSPPGPAYSPQSFTLTSYTQYFANLTYINNDFVAQSEPPSSSLSTLDAENGAAKGEGENGAGDGDGNVSPTGKWKKGKHGHHQGKKPRPKPHPKRFAFEIEYDTRTDEKYGMDDLTVRSWVDLARRIGQGDDVEGEGDVEEAGKKKRNWTWLTFVERAFVGTLEGDEVEVFARDAAAAAERPERVEESGSESEDEEEEVLEL